jgi:hypothetical protein
MMSPLGTKVINRAPLTPFEVAIVTVSVGLPGSHDNDVVNEASGASGAVVDVEVEGVVVVDVDEVVDVVDVVVVVVVVDVDDVDAVVVVVVGGSPAIAALFKTTANAREPLIANAAQRDLDVGTATPRVAGRQISAAAHGCRRPRPSDLGIPPLPTGHSPDSGQPPAMQVGHALISRVVR